MTGLNTPFAPISTGGTDHFAARFLRAVTTSHVRACLVLVLLSLACFLPGFVSLQPMDRDEPRFAQASKQMLETGDFVDIRFQEEARHKKPVGIYWMQAATVAAAEAVGVPRARATIAVYRLPSLLGALATVLLTYWAVLGLATRREAFLAAAFMGASVILMVESKLAKTDAVLAACCVAAMGALARLYLARGLERAPLSTVLTLWFAMAIGILIKGPLVILFAGAAAAALSMRERSARWLLPARPWLGLALVLLVVAPWFTAILIKSGGGFLAASAGQDLLGKVGTAQIQHWAPPGTYALAFFGTFWPGAILAAIAVNYAYAHRRDDAIAFCLAWIVPAWLVFEAVPTKLPHYIMPIYPAIAAVTAIAITRGFVGPHRPLARPATILIPFIPAALLAGVAVGSTTFGTTIPWLGVVVVAMSVAVSAMAWWVFVRGETGRAAIYAIVASPILALGILGLSQPHFTALKLSPRLAEVTKTLTCPDSRIATLGYREPSFVFLTRTDLEMLETGEEAAAFLTGGECRMVFVERRFEGSFRAALGQGATDPQTRVRGFNINGGRWLDIAAYARRP